MTYRKCSNQYDENVRCLVCWACVTDIYFQILGCQGKTTNGADRFIWKCIVPFITILLSFGRFPFQRNIKNDTSTFIYKWNSGRGLLFFFTSFVILAFNSLAIYGCIVEYLSARYYRHTDSCTFNCANHSNNGSTTDKSSINDNNPMFIILCLVFTSNALFQSIMPIFIGQKTARFLTSWPEGLMETGLHIKNGMIKHVVFQVTYIICFVMMMITLFVTPPKEGDFHFVVDAIRMLMKQTLQMFLKEPDEIPYLRNIFFSFLVICFCSYNCYIFIYLCVSRTLKNAFSDWNNRIIKAICLKTIFSSSCHPLSVRSEGDNVYEDLEHLINSHFALVDIVTMANDVFAPVIQGFFATQILMICAELHIIVNVEWVDEVHSPIFVAFVISTFVLLYITTIIASDVHDEAMEGFARVGKMMKMDLTFREEKRLKTLLTSFSSSPIFMTGGKFFSINRGFFLTIVGVTSTYFFVICQMTKTTY